MPEDEVHKSGTEARAGSPANVVRWILGISLALVVIIFAVILLVRT